MKIKRLVKGAVYFSCVTAVIALSAVFATPFLLDREKIRSQIIQQISLWTGDDISINGKVRIDYLMGATINAEKVEFRKLVGSRKVSSISAGRMAVEFDWFDLLFGKISLKQVQLFSPQIILTADIDNINVSRDLVSLPVNELFSKTLSGRLKIYDGRLKLGTRTSNFDFTSVNADIRHNSSNGKFSGRMQFSYRDLPHRLDFRLLKNSGADNNSDILFSYNISSNMFGAGFDGSLASDGRFGMNGQQTLVIHDVGKLADWSGTDLRGFPGIKLVDIRANMMLDSNRLVMSDTQLAIDQNRAAGVITAVFDDRLTIDGTLAFDSFDLSGYFEGSGPAVKNRQQVKPLSLDFFEFLNADLRISANSIPLQNLAIENSAITLSLKSGRLVVNVLDMSICEGSARGQLEIGKDNGIPALGLQAQFDNFSTSRCLEAFRSEDMVHGTASAALRISANGATAREMQKTLAGEWSLRMPSGGQINMDLPQLFSLIQTHPVKGWGDIISGTTHFDSLTISTSMLKGTATVQARMQVDNETSFSGNGTFYIPENSMDYQVVMSSPYKTGNTGKSAANVRGQWKYPEIAVFSPSRTGGAIGKQPD